MEHTENKINTTDVNPTISIKTLCEWIIQFSKKTVIIKLI